MSARPLVSVVTIFLDEERFLPEAIESVLGQTYKDWELILVDDGSSDASTTIARELADKHPDRIRYVEHADHGNRGMSASRNRGLDEAAGRYITFLDADDVFLPDKLEQQVALLELRPEAEFVCGRAEWWYDWAAGDEPAQPGQSRHDFVQSIDLALDEVAPPPSILVAFLRDEWASLCDVMVLTDTARELGGSLCGGVPEHVRGPGLPREADPQAPWIRLGELLVPIPPAPRRLYCDRPSDRRDPRRATPLPRVARTLRLGTRHARRRCLASGSVRTPAIPPAACSQTAGACSQSARSSEGARPANSRSERAPNGLDVEGTK